jgi:hypothetical protein
VDVAAGATPKNIGTRAVVASLDHLASGQMSVTGHGMRAEVVPASGFGTEYSDRATSM